MTKNPSHLQQARLAYQSPPVFVASSRPSDVNRDGAHGGRLVSEIRVNLNELDVSVKLNELLMSTGCIVGFVSKTKEFPPFMTCIINSTQKHTLLCYTVFCSTQ